MYNGATQARKQEFTAMAKLTNKLIHDALDAGRSVAWIAEAADVTRSAVYNRMRQLGRSATAVAAERTSSRGNWIHLPSYDGYRIHPESGRVQSCWTRGQEPQKTEHWRDLSVQTKRRGASVSLYVQLGSRGTRHRPSLLALLKDALGQFREHKATAIYDRLRESAR